MSEFETTFCSCPGCGTLIPANQWYCSDCATKLPQMPETKDEKLNRIITLLEEIRELLKK